MNAARGATLALCLAVRAACAGEPPQVMVTPAYAEDEVGVKSEPEALSIDITSPRGAGTAQVRLIDGEWPALVRLRFHGLATLESLRVQAGELTLRCTLVRIEDGPSGHPCRLAGEAQEPVRPGDGHFDVRLPRALLDAGAPLAVEWVDRWPR